MFAVHTNRMLPSLNKNRYNSETSKFAPGYPANICSSRLIQGVILWRNNYNFPSFRCLVIARRAYCVGASLNFPFVRLLSVVCPLSVCHTQFWAWNPPKPPGGVAVRVQKHAVLGHLDCSEQEIRRRHPVACQFAFKTTSIWETQ